MKKSTVALVVAVLALAVAGVAFFSGDSSLGNVQHNQKESFMQGLFAGTNRQLDIDNSGQVKLGTDGTRLAGIVTGSATVWAPATTIAASTTQAVELQTATNGALVSGLTGVTADSTCFVQHASSTNSTSNGIAIVGASASSTAGSIVVHLSNLTGTTFTWNATASSSAKWKFTCFDPS